jgi:hypothetical protein
MIYTLLVQPWRVEVRQKVGDDGNEEEYARTVDDVLMQLF